MKLSDFPRPRNDNGRGVHWSARVYHPSGADLDFWIDELLAMQIKWVKLLDDGDGSAVELCRRLLDAEIMPVVRLFRERPNPGRLGGRELSGLAKLIAAGVRYFESNNEPDLPAEWQNGHMPKNWLDIVTDNFIYDADIILKEGGLPAVPAMGPGGTENVVQKAVDRGRADLFEKGAWFAIHNYTLNHPLDYPDDSVNQQGTPLTQAEYDHFGSWSWDNRSLEMINDLRARAANPGHTVADDPNCFRGWEEAGHKIHAALGYHIPVISTEGGPVVGWGDDKRYPKMIPSQQAEFQMEIMRFMQDEAPDWYFSCCTWLLAARPLGDPSPTWDQMGWYTDAWNQRFGLAGRLPIVQMLKDTPSRPRRDVRHGSASVAGTVRRADTGAPLAAVTVSAVGEALTAQATSDTQGRYLVDGLTPGAYALQVDGVELAQVRLEENDQGAADLAVTAGQMGRIHGQVVDTGDAPQPGLVVALHGVPSSAVPASGPLAATKTDGMGRFSFGGLAAGSYILRAAPGTDQAADLPGVQIDGWTDVQVELVVQPPPGFVYRAETRLLSPQETGNRNAIFGIITDAAGQPVQGKTVRMRWTGAGPDTRFPTTVTGKDPFKPAGYFEFMHTPGVFLVDVMDEEWESDVAGDLVTADRPERTRPISYEVNFQLRPRRVDPVPVPQPDPTPVPVPDPLPDPTPDPTPDPGPQPPPAHPRLAHYVLLAPEAAQADLMQTLLHLITPFVLDSKAQMGLAGDHPGGVTVGFDPAPARHADRLTVIGQLDPTLAGELRETGMRIDTVAADPFTLTSALEALL